ncbi:regulator of microtubule dynamics protein 1 [Ditylenchus destructor]|uniref:Regulator of microtubule dynamics protein 1 n=1 Tax=Ditylenchus destructor TaxID=166010 RepID=A0AAD4N831_9BILA|nr:regulator of microtubule dynamics protein 1 [Ditylenchus destructor]
MFGRFASRIFQFRSHARVRRAFLYTFSRIGARSATFGTPILALSFFGSAKPAPDVVAGDPTKDFATDAVIREADILYDAYLLDKLHDLLKQYRSATNPELLWRLARVLCELFKNTEDEKKKKQYLKEALNVVRDALQNQSEIGASYAVHKWYAIILNYWSEFQGSKAQIESAQEVKTHFERALQLNSLDATTWHLLGIWHFEVADLSYVKRLAAKAFYGTPPSSTYKEALRHFRKAEKIQPNFYSANQYYMGLCLERIKNNNIDKQALECYKRAFLAPVLSKDDIDTQKKAKDRLIAGYGFTQDMLDCLKSM